jgi:hypothetical protein
MANWHFILDYETLANDSTNCAAIDCSYVAFDWDRFADNPYKFDELLGLTQRAKFDVQDQVKRHKFNVDMSVIEWWQTQAVEVKSLIKPSPNDITIETFLDDMIQYLNDYTPIKYWWSRSNTFDPVILGQQATRGGKLKEINKLLQFWKVRDMRTFIDAKTNFSLKKNDFVPVKDEAQWNKMFKQHSSRHDIVADILRLQTLTRLDMNLDVPE